jgi:hypothetical protein
VPKPPENGLILRGFCTYARRGGDGKVSRSEEWYYRENPDRWAAETQSDLLWLTEKERRALIPAEPKAGDRAPVAAAVRSRFFSTIGIDYMEGSVNALPVREAVLETIVESISADRLELRLEGLGTMGREYDESLRREKNSRGCRLRVLGRIGVDRAKQAIDRFDVAGVGLAWGNKMEYVGREVRLADHPWTYGIAVELVATRTPADLLPPYNLLHYGSGLKYFEGP